MDGRLASFVDYLTARGFEVRIQVTEPESEATVTFYEEDGHIIRDEDV